MKKFALSAAVLGSVILLGASADRADAAGFQISFGGPAVYGGYSQGYGYGGHGYGYGAGYAPNCYRGAVWHDTSHYDYVPSRVVRHRNHYHVQPGGYIYHHDGHWDHH